MYFRIKHYPELSTLGATQEKHAIAAIISSSKRAKTYFWLVLATYVSLVAVGAMLYRPYFDHSPQKTIAILVVLLTVNLLIRAILIATIYRQEFVQHKDTVMKTMGL
jgi:hypothetical protein